MPINEAPSHHSNLTAQQKREAEAAVYGLPTPMTPHELSAEDIQRMRMIIAQHDAQQAPMTEFDLNKPPRRHTLAPGTPGADGPYQHQAFPRMLYDHENRAYKTARNQPEMEALLSMGYRLDPYPTDAPAEPELDATKLEVAAIDKKAREKKAK